MPKNKHQPEQTAQSYFDEALASLINKQIATRSSSSQYLQFV